MLAVIEGLAGASYEDIVKDYMVTYENYYGITELKDKEKYDAYVKNRIDDILQYIADIDTSGGTVGLALNEIDWVNVMGRYLIDNGMTMEDMDNLYKNLMDMNKMDYYYRPNNILLLCIPQVWFLVFHSLLYF